MILFEKNDFLQLIQLKSCKNKQKIFEKFLKKSKITTGASPGTFFTVSGTARMVPAEDLKVHIGSKQRVGIAYYHLAFNKKPTVDRRNSNGCTDSMKLHIFIEGFVYPRQKSCLQNMVYKDPFVVNTRFQSQYTCACVLKVRTHVPFHSVSQTRAILKTGPFWRTDGRTLVRWAPSVRKKVRPSAGKNLGPKCEKTPKMKIERP